MITDKPKRSHHKKKPINGTKPVLGHPDPLEAAQEAARHAQEGNRKLALAVDTLRSTLETISMAEVDHATGRPVTAEILRTLAVQGLDSYSTVSGQNWRRVKLTGASRAGDRNLSTLEA